MSEKSQTKFFCDRYPEYELVLEPADIQVVGNTRRTKRIPSKRVIFKKNAYGVGEYVCSDSAILEWLNEHPRFLDGTIYIGDKGKAEKPKDTASQGAVGTTPKEEGSAAAVPAPAEEKPVRKGAKVPKRKAE